MTPTGGVDAGGGSSIAGGGQTLMALGVLSLLAAMGVAVVATRPHAGSCGEAGGVGAGGRAR
ncbi:MAG: hypothetical protein ABW022_15060, partial [Actinoplanes sp.]